jgi:hypothetical protein
MFEIAIIVQIKEVAGDGRGGRLAVGFSKISAEKLIPQKAWSENFLAALRRAMNKRGEYLQEIDGIARGIAVVPRRKRREKPLPLFEEPF